MMMKKTKFTVNTHYLCEIPTTILERFV